MKRLCLACSAPAEGVFPVCYRHINILCDDCDAVDLSTKFRKGSIQRMLCYQCFREATK